MKEIIEKLEDACSLVSAIKHSEGKCDTLLSELHTLLHEIRKDVEEKEESLHAYFGR